MSSFFGRQSVWIHNFKFAKHPATVSQRHSPLLCYLVGRQIQSLQKCRIAGKYTPLLVQTAIAAVKAFNGVGGVNGLSYLCGKFEDRRYHIPIFCTSSSLRWDNRPPIFQLLSQAAQERRPQTWRDKWFSNHWQILSYSYRSHISTCFSPDELCSVAILSAETPHLRFLSYRSVRLHR